MSEGSDNREDLYLESYAFTTAAAIVGSVDRKMFVLMRDGRNLFGILRTFDQFANLVLQDTTERIYLPNNEYAEAYHDVFLIRGENVAMMGELDIDKEDAPLEKYQRVDFGMAKAKVMEERKEQLDKNSKTIKKMTKFGLTGEFKKFDLF